jgi:predicted NAD-dependent protein-ADP-ribosyltransferase YbiA (DUF1768 family)
MITNIHSKGNYPADALSNFAPHPFEFDGVSVACMEGLLQSFKFPDPQRQQEICQFSAKEAKVTGSAQAWQQHLYWKGAAYPRKSKTYRQLLIRAYDAMAAQNPAFRTALLASKPILLHTIGRWRRPKTCLTWWEFCGILTRLRRKLR